MVTRSGAGVRRAVVAAAAVAGFGMMVAGGAIAADKDHGPNDYSATAQSCSIVPDWQYYRKCGDTGSTHEPHAQAAVHVRDPQEPSDNEPTGGETAAPARH